MVITISILQCSLIHFHHNWSTVCSSNTHAGTKIPFFYVFGSHFTSGLHTPYVATYPGLAHPRAAAPFFFFSLTSDFWSCSKAKQAKPSTECYFIRLMQQHPAAFEFSVSCSVMIIYYFLVLKISLLLVYN